MVLHVGIVFFNTEVDVVLLVSTSNEWKVIQLFKKNKNKKNENPK